MNVAATCILITTTSTQHFGLRPNHLASGGRLRIVCLWGVKTHRRVFSRLGMGVRKRWECWSTRCLSAHGGERVVGFGEVREKSGRRSERHWWWVIGEDHCEHRKVHQGYFFFRWKLL